VILCLHIATTAGNTRIFTAKRCTFSPFRHSGDSLCGPAELCAVAGYGHCRQWLATCVVRCVGLLSCVLLPGGGHCRQVATCVVHCVGLLSCVLLPDCSHCRQVATCVVELQCIRAAVLTGRSPKSLHRELYLKS
jgi:hypothetical protein